VKTISVPAPLTELGSKMGWACQVTRLIFLGPPGLTPTGNQRGASECPEYAVGNAYLSFKASLFKNLSQIRLLCRMIIRLSFSKSAFFP